MHVTVHLIDNDREAVATLCALVAPVGFHVESHLSTAEFLRGHDSRQPGCLVARLGMPGLDGMEFLRELNARKVHMPAVFVTSHVDIADIVSLMQSGAVSLLEKPYRNRTLLAAIQSAVRLSTERLMVSQRRRELQERMRLLSEDERVVLHDLVAGSTNKQIASRLGVALRTVEYRRHNIFSKLQVQSIAEMAATVAELDRLADISAMQHAPPMRLADSRFTSLCMPMRMRVVGRDRLALDPAHARSPEPVPQESAMTARVRS